MKLAVAGSSGVVGRHVLALAQQQGHEVTELTRARGCDLSTAKDLSEFLEGVESIIDVSNTSKLSYAAASRYFMASSSTLSQEGSRLGTRHLVSLSIVGLEQASSYGYYRAKLDQERVVKDGPLAHSIVRATQFHEFTPQIMSRLSWGPLCVVPHLKVQTVAARCVAEQLLEVATNEPTGATLNVAGPEVDDIVQLARRYAKVQRSPRVVALPTMGKLARALTSGALLAPPHARIIGPSFDEWLTH
jgi:uncharacterized protein YbjT (DUF2867 family)